MDKVDKIFESFVGESIFKNKSILQSNYYPENILHREEQVGLVASILAPALRGERVSNLFIYGNTGTGKTLGVQFVRNKMLEKVKELGTDNLKFVYLNCKMKSLADTEYRILAELINEMGGKVPATGLPTKEVYSRFVDIIDSKKQVILIVLDEIDQAVQKISGDFIYSLTRLNSELKNAQISLIGISNNLTFMDNIDPRVKSSLAEEELVFPPYNALQLQDLLKTRADKAFKENILEEGVIAKCAAFAAREHGDARRALDLLRVAGELAERESKKKVTLEHIDEANRKIEKDKVISIVENAPRQFQLVLASIMAIDRRGKNPNGIFTGEVYDKYKAVCEKTKNEELTLRRLSDILAELDMLGIIYARVISKGRQGRTREIKPMLSPAIKEQVCEILQKSLGI